MLLPTARGPLSAGVIASLLDVEPDHPPVLAAADEPARLVADPDFQLALWTVLEALDGGFDGIGTEHAERPELLRWRTVLSERWLAALRELTAPMVREAGGDTASPSRIGDHLISLMRGSHTALHPFIENKATTTQLRELVTAKCASQATDVLRALGLEDDRRAHIDRVPAVAIAAHNTQRVLSLPNPGSATAIGHRAASTATALLFDRRLAGGLRRLGILSVSSPVHDAVQRWNEQLDLCREHLSAHPGKTQDLLHAAAAAIAVEGLLHRHLSRCWTRTTPVLEPVRAVAVIGGESAAVAGPAGQRLKATS